ncbi:hypothetical protein AB0D78_28300 [Streptomyces avermitilis]|uniref:hypothetical protein n=1 Tax=Streptomyces avermitilis TaxID=33903 RepID=UPI0033D3454A
MTDSYSPLRGPDEEQPHPAAVDGELRLAREYADKVANANIHDHNEMIRTAVGFDHRLRSLIAAVEAERGES